MDAAIAFLFTDSLGTATPLDGYGAPNSTTKKATIGQEVQKYGRTTGLTNGAISSIEVTIDVCYEHKGPFLCGKNKLARFKEQIGITPGEFSTGATPALLS